MNEGQLSGRVVKVLEPRKGVSKNTGKDFFIQEYVVETEEDFPTKVHFSLFGEDKVKQYNLQEGDMIQVAFYVNSREYNERWYTDIRVRNIIKLDPSQMYNASMGQQPMGGPVPQGMPNYGTQPQGMPSYGAQPQGMPYGSQPQAPQAPYGTPPSGTTPDAPVDDLPF